LAQERLRATRAMGNTLPGRTGALGRCAPAGRGQRTADGNVILSVVRTKHWGLGDTEDTWLVEVGPTATVADLKVTIEQLYDVSYESQLLSTKRYDYLAYREALQDTLPIDGFAKQKIYLFPSPDAIERLALNGQRRVVEGEVDFQFAGGAGQAPIAVTQGTPLADQENAELNTALEESLRGVTYQVNFHRPESAGGAAAGRRLCLAIDALALVDDVQQLVELELFGAVGVEPAFLHLGGTALLPTVTFFQAGVQDGATVEVSTEPPAYYGVTVTEDVLRGMLEAGQTVQPMPT